MNGDPFLLAPDPKLLSVNEVFRKINRPSIEYQRELISPERLTPAIETRPWRHRIDVFLDGAQYNVVWHRDNGRPEKGDIASALNKLSHMVDK